VYAAVAWAARACLRLVRPRPGTAAETEPPGAWQGRVAASMWVVRASSFCMRSISLFTRFKAAANTCLRCKGCSAMPGKLSPLGDPLPRASRRFARARVRSLLRMSRRRWRKHLEVINHCVIDFGMMTAHDDLMLVVAEDAALEFAGYGHRFLEYSFLLLVCAQCGHSQDWRCKPPFLSIERLVKRPCLVPPSVSLLARWIVKSLALGACRARSQAAPCLRLCF